MQALIVIDMQNAWIEENPRYELDAVIGRINRLIAHFRQQSKPIIFIQHVQGTTLSNTYGWQIDDKLHHQESDHYVNKTACDSFESTDLLELLHKEACTTLSICGLATEFCVDTTLHSALSHGFDVIALSDAHTTADRTHLNAKSIIEHHNWVWANLALPTQRKLQVMSTKDYLES
jgi:nicotinamidase-related amidase